MKLEDVNSIVNDTNEGFKKDIIIINKTEKPPSLFLEVKRSLGLENYPDSSFIIYIFVLIFAVEKLNNVLSFVKNVITIPKQVSETYSFITKKDLILIDKLDDLMNQLLGVTGGDRVAIAKIHNGTFDNTGTHQMKFSMIYEVISNRAKPTKSDVQNIPVNYIKEEILLGSSNDFQRIERTKLNSKCDRYLDKIGIVAKDYKLLTVNKIIYGILDIHFITTPEFDYNNNEALLKRFNLLVSSIEECLQSIILKRTLIQKMFSNIFKVDTVFK